MKCLDLDKEKELERKLLELCRKEMGDDFVEILYKRTSKYHRGEQTIIAIISTRGHRKYPDDISSRDRLLQMAIVQSHKCPFCNRYSNYLAAYPFSFDDQIAMWREVFKVTIKLQERIKQIEKLGNLLAELKSRV